MYKKDPGVAVLSKALKSASQIWVIDNGGMSNPLSEASQDLIISEWEDGMSVYLFGGIVRVVVFVVFVVVVVAVFAYLCLSLLIFAYLCLSLLLNRQRSILC